MVIEVVVVAVIVALVAVTVTVTVAVTVTVTVNVTVIVAATPTVPPFRTVARAGSRQTAPQLLLDQLSFIMTSTEQFF